MSSGQRETLGRARMVAESMMQMLNSLSRWHCIAGSIRREKVTVGDIEIVIEPENKQALLNHLDYLVWEGMVSKAQYGEKQTTRWGETYRGMVYQGMLVEVFLCDEHNRGFQHWLRTGSGDKNQYVMQRMMACKSEVRFSGGYGWHVSYEKSHPAFDSDKGYARLNKLSIPDELTLYQLLGMKPIVPQYRDTQAYRPYLENWVFVPAVDVLQGMYVKEIKQQRLF